MRTLNLYKEFLRNIETIQSNLSTIEAIVKIKKLGFNWLFFQHFAILYA